MTLSAYIIDLKQQFLIKNGNFIYYYCYSQKDLYIKSLFNKCEKRFFRRALEVSRLYAKISFLEQISSKAHNLSFAFGSVINPAKTFLI